MEAPSAYNKSLPLYRLRISVHLLFFIELLNNLPGRRIMDFRYIGKPWTLAATYGKSELLNHKG
jgi:hypothetical protein